MLKQLRDRITETSSVCSIEIQLEGAEMLFNWVLLSKKKQVLVIDKKGSVKGGLKILLGFVDASTPLLISLSGKGVLHKTVAQQGGDTNKLFDYIFPNARISDYLIQTVLCNNNSYLVSVTRKEQIDKLLNELNVLGYHILSVGLGPFSVLPMFKALGTEVKDLHFARHEMKVDAYTPSVYTYQQENVLDEQVIELAGEKVESYLVPAYALAFNFLVGIEQHVLQYDAIDASIETYRDKKIFKLLSWGSLIFFFSLLLINTIFFTLLSSTNNELSAQYSGMQVESASMQKNTEEFNQKELFLEKAGWLDASLLSYYADRIAASLPQEIQLTDLEVYPLNIALTRKNKKETFDQSLIVVKGITLKPTDLNKWTKVLDEYTWASQVKVHDYTFDHKTGKSSFTIQLNTSGELE